MRSRTATARRPRAPGPTSAGSPDVSLLRPDSLIGSRQETLIRLVSTQPQDRAGALRLLDRCEQVILRLMQSTPLEASNLMDELLADELTDLAQAELRWIARTRDKLSAA